MTILITGARAPIALEISRSFAGSGHKIIMADSQVLPVARWSNTVFRYYTLPSPADKTDEFIRALNDIIEIEKVDHLIPTCEETFYISKHLSFLTCSIWTSPFPIIDILHNKALFMEIAGDFFAVPKTISAVDFSDWSNCSKYVFKKKYSRFATAVLIGEESFRMDCSGINSRQ